jgi:hypothetical protein
MYYNWRNPAGATRGSFLAKTILGLYWPSSAAMKNIFEVLRDKETHLGRLRIEVDALRIVAPLLVDGSVERREVEPARPSDLAWTPTLQKNKWPLKAGGPAPTYSDS